METGSKKLIQDCPTRWNSSFYMFECIVEMRWPISAVLSDESVTKRSNRSLDLRSEQCMGTSRRASQGAEAL